MSDVRIVRLFLAVLMLVLLIFIVGTTATGSPWQVWGWGCLHLSWAIWAWRRLGGVAAARDDDHAPGA